MLVNIGTFIGEPSGARFSAYGISLTAPVLAFASATDPDSDNTQDLTIDIADPGAIAGDEIVVRAKIGADFTGSLQSEYDLTTTYTVVAGDVGVGGDFTGEISGFSLTPDGVAYLRAFHKRGTTYSSPSTTISKTIDTTAPTITSATTANNAENSVLAHSLTANESVTWALNGGADVALFEISGSTLRWASNGTQDYETPADAGANNIYNVTVRATDTAGNTTDQNIAVTVTDVGEGSPAMTFVTSATGNSAGAGTVNTISSLALGSAINGRLCVAVITTEFALDASITVTSLTIGGVTATVAGFDGQEGTSTMHTVIGAAILNSGDPTSGDVVLTTSHTMGAAVECTVLTFDNASSATAVDSEKPTANVDNTTRTLNVTEGGVVVGIYGGGNGAYDVTPTGMTEVVDKTSSTSNWRHAAYYDLQASTGTDTMSLDSLSGNCREQYASYR